jgi:hypothetical protein
MLDGILNVNEPVDNVIDWVGVVVDDDVDGDVAVF